MSAFIVDPEHIHVMIWAATRHVNHLGPLRWYYGNPTAAGASQRRQLRRSRANVDR